MDISQTIPLLLANIVRFLMFNTARGRKIYFLILSLIIVALGTILFFELLAPAAVADFSNDNSVYLEDIFEPGLVILGDNSLVSVSAPFTSTFQPRRTINVVVTAYSSTPWETDGNPYITASGNWVKDGIIANNYLPFGTQIRIPELYGNKVFTVEDRMSWKKGNYHIDIWFPSYWEALNFGAKRTYIEVLEG